MPTLLSLTGPRDAATLVRMCNLYAQKHPRELVADFFRVSDNRAGQAEPKQSIFPGMNAPVVRKAGDGERELVELSWGFVLLMKDYAPKRVTNTRDDKLGSSFWSGSFRERRCLVPVSSFSEPKGKKPAIWNWFALNEARDLFSFAGIWRSYKGPIKKDGETVAIDVFSFVTTTPNELVATIHPSRMPVMLVGLEACDQWINGTDTEAEALIRPYPADQMIIVQASEEKADLAA